MKDFLQDILKSAGGVIAPFFGTECVEYTKQGGAMDLVTKADLAGNEVLIKAIQSRYPDHGIISEETGEYQGEAAYRWTIDPVDGTANFAYGVPIFMVMVSLLYQNQPILSGLYHPITHDLAMAEKGKGAWMNGERIHCSTKRSLSETFGCASTVVNQKLLGFYQTALRFHPSIKVGAFGCAAYTGLMVASGKRDWLVTFHDSVWDIAPIALILHEAGCVITNTQGAPWKLGDDIVAANASLHQDLMHVLATREP